MYRPAALASAATVHSGVPQLLGPLIWNPLPAMYHLRIRAQIRDQYLESVMPGRSEALEAMCGMACQACTRKATAMALKHFMLFLQERTWTLYKDSTSIYIYICIYRNIYNIEIERESKRERERENPMCPSLTWPCNPQY